MYTKQDLGQELKRLLDEEELIFIISQRMYSLSIDLDMNYEVYNIMHDLAAMEDEAFEYSREELYSIADDLIAGKKPFLRDSCCFCARCVVSGDKDIYLYTNELWGNKEYKKYGLLSSHFNCLKNKLHSPICFNNKYKNQYECCFCDKKIEKKEYGIVPMPLIKYIDNDPKNRKETTLYTHLDCLKKVVHPKVFLYGKKIQDVI